MFGVPTRYLSYFSVRSKRIESISFEVNTLYTENVKSV